MRVMRNVHGVRISNLDTRLVAFVAILALMVALGVGQLSTVPVTHASGGSSNDGGYGYKGPTDCLYMTLTGLAATGSNSERMSGNLKNNCVGTMTSTTEHFDFHTDCPYGQPVPPSADYGSPGLYPGQLVGYIYSRNFQCFLCQNHVITNSPSFVLTVTASASGYDAIGVYYTSQTPSQSMNVLLTNGVQGAC